MYGVVSACHHRHVACGDASDYHHHQCEVESAESCKWKKSQKKDRLRKPCIVCRESQKEQKGTRCSVTQNSQIATSRIEHIEYKQLDEKHGDNASATEKHKVQSNKKHRNATNA